MQKDSLCVERIEVVSSRINLMFGLKIFAAETGPHFPDVRSPGIVQET